MKLNSIKKKKKKNYVLIIELLVYLNQFAYTLHLMKYMNTSVINLHMKGTLY